MQAGDIFAGLENLPPSVPSSWIPKSMFYSPSLNDKCTASSTKPQLGRDNQSVELRQRIAILENELSIVRQEKDGLRKLAKNLQELLVVETNVSLFYSQENKNLEKEKARLQTENARLREDCEDEKKLQRMIEETELPRMQDPTLERATKRLKNTWWCSCCEKNICTNNKKRHLGSEGHRLMMEQKGSTNQS